MKTIEITTAQKVTIQYELAAIGNRILASFIDFIVIMIIGVVLRILLAIAMQGDSELVLGIFTIVGAVLYDLVAEISMNGQTIGKRMLGLKVVKINGDTPHAYDYFIRWAFRFIDVWLSFGAVAALVSSATPAGQRLGDLLAGTTVIRETSSRVFSLQDILKIATLENYTVTYDNVTKLSEKDMLFVKQVLERERLYNNAAHQEAVKLLAERLGELLNVGKIPNDRRQFLRTLLNDYIVLTR